MNLNIFLYICIFIGFVLSNCAKDLAAQYMPEDKFVEEEFVQKLKNGEKLEKLFAENWTFVYYEYNRSTGQTKGIKIYLKPEIIDDTIRLYLHTDGMGWEPDTSKRMTFLYAFVLKDWIKKWERIRFCNSMDLDLNEYCIEGSGESDNIFIVIQKNLICRLEYHTVDPG